MAIAIRSMVMALTAVLVLVSSCARAQNRRGDFEKAIDYCSCKIDFAFCNHYAKTHPGTKEQASFDKIKTKFNCKLGSSTSYGALDTTLNNNSFPSLSRKNSIVFGEMIIDSGAIKKSGNTPYNIIDAIYNEKNNLKTITNDADVSVLKSSLTMDLVRYFKTNTIDHNTKSIDSQVIALTEEISQMKEEVKTLHEGVETLKKNNSSSIRLNIFIAVSILSIVCAFGFYAIFKYRHIRDNEKGDYSKMPPSSTSQNNAKQIEAINVRLSKLELKTDYADNISNINNAIVKLNEDLSLALTKLENLTKDSAGRTPLQGDKQYSHQQLDSHYLQQQQNNRQQQTGILYAPSPNKDGSFIASSVKSVEDPSSSFYKFTLTDKNAQAASFEFLNVERAVQDATSSPELILYPVCKSKSPLNQNAKGIVTKKPGQVIKQNDKWQTVAMAEIEYE